MDWIKRNLYFLIGGVVALALMGAAGWFLYTKWDLNNQIVEKLNADYAELDNFNKLRPHPGYGQVNNIQAAKDQTQQLRGLIDGGRKYFQRIAPIPEVAKITDRDFSAALSRTIDQLQRDATNASVMVPANYNFSFETQKNKMAFAPGSLPLLAQQLGEVKALCDILFQSKINSLENIRRERVSTDDSAGASTSDYLSDKSITNELAVLTPYEVTFKSFSAELATVLSGLASSPYGVVVKTINVEPAPVQPSSEQNPLAYTPVTQVAQPVTPAAETAAATAAFNRRYGIGGASAEARMADRYGIGAGANRGGVQLRTAAPAYPTYTPPVAQPGMAPAAVPRTGLNTVLDEKQLKVTLELYLVKLLPAK